MRHCGATIALLAAWAAGAVAEETWTGPLTPDGRPQPGIVATGLRCEWCDEPEGIVTRAPRLSWVVFSGERGQRQTAYRILAASSPDRLAPGRADLWDTGRVESNATLSIEYTGKPLASGQRVFWKAMAWDKDGKGIAMERCRLVGRTT